MPPSPPAGFSRWWGGGFTGEEFGDDNGGQCPHAAMEQVGDKLTEV
jgi:hypothetical protein